MTRSRLGGLVLTVALLGAALATVGLGAGVAAARTGSGAPAHRVRQAGTTVTITAGDNFFKPQTVEIDPGTTVKWVNKGRNLHNVAPDKGKLYGTSSLPSGKSYSFTFKDPGTYGYYCTFHGAPKSGMFGTITVRGTATGDGAVTTTTPTGGTAPSGKPRTIKVPADSQTIQGAVDQANPGDLVLVSPGVYKEAVTVTRPNVVIRGVDRNTTILEGSFQLDNGVKVVDADGVAVENMTARDYKGNGFYWTGVQGYRGSYLTAYRNGDYGIYGFDSVNGQFDHSYASGSPDSGFYIGQCNPCNAVITDVVAEYNQLGYSGTNASNQLFIVNSVWRNNRAGIVPNTLDSEALPPQGNAVLAGNRIYDNQSTKAARSETAEFDAAFGSGIAVIGGNDNIITKNLVLNQTRAGIALAPNPGIQTNTYESTGNKVTDNIVRGSGLADLAVLATPASANNCFSGNVFKKSSPANIEKAAPCTGTGTGDFTTGAIDIAPFLDTSKNPPATPYAQTPVPPKQANMRNPRTAKAVPATTDKVPAVTVDLTKIKAPKKK